MVRIIQRGKLPEEKVYKTTCKHCYTIFEFTEKEAKEYISYRNEPVCLQIACPLCKKYCYVTKKYN